MCVYLSAYFFLRQKENKCICFYFQLNGPGAPSFHRKRNYFSLLYFVYFRVVVVVVVVCNYTNHNRFINKKQHPSHKNIKNANSERPLYNSRTRWSSTTNLQLNDFAANSSRCKKAHQTFTYMFTCSDINLAGSKKSLYLCKIAINSIFLYAYERRTFTQKNSTGCTLIKDVIE